MEPGTIKKKFPDYISKRRSNSMGTKLFSVWVLSFFSTNKLVEMKQRKNIITINNKKLILAMKAEQSSFPPLHIFLASLNNKPFKSMLTA